MFDGAPLRNRWASYAQDGGFATGSGRKPATLSDLLTDDRHPPKKRHAAADAVSPALGDKTIKRNSTFACALLAMPLVLGGCGLPVGVTVASFIADGVSLLTTEKTLTDHGISLVTDEDCALWRSLKGEDICHAEGRGATTVADGGAPADPAAADPPASPVSTASAAPVDVAPLGDAAPAAAQSEPLPPPAAAASSVATPRPGTKAGADGTATFLVIASYAREGDAEHFARLQRDLVTAVLPGTAHGKQVYRVAVGPVAKAERKAVKGRLVGVGFTDAWALTLDRTAAAVQVAALPAAPRTN